MQKPRVAWNKVREMITGRDVSHNHCHVVERLILLEVKVAQRPSIGLITTVLRVLLLITRFKPSELIM